MINSNFLSQTFDFAPSEDCTEALSRLQSQSSYSLHARPSCVLRDYFLFSTCTAFLCVQRLFLILHMCAIYMYNEQYAKIQEQNLQNMLFFLKAKCGSDAAIPIVYWPRLEVSVHYLRMTISKIRLISAIKFYLGFHSVWCIEPHILMCF